MDAVKRVYWQACLDSASGLIAQLSQGDPASVLAGPLLASPSSMLHCGEHYVPEGQSRNISAPKTFSSNSSSLVLSTNELCLLDEREQEPCVLHISFFLPLVHGLLL